MTDQFAWLPGLLKSDEPEKLPPSEKELKVASNKARNWFITISLKLFQEEEKRKLAQEEAEKERKKKHIKEEYQREKVSITYVYHVNREKGQITIWLPVACLQVWMRLTSHAKLLTFAGSSKYPGQVRDRKETAHKQKWQAEGSHDGGAEEGVWAGWWRCQRTWGQDEESMKSKTESQFFASIQLFFRMLLSAMQLRRKLSRRWRWRWDTTRAWSDQ